MNNSPPKQQNRIQSCNTFHYASKCQRPLISIIPLRRWEREAILTDTIGQCFLHTHRIRRAVRRCTSRVTRIMCPVWILTTCHLSKRLSLNPAVFISTSGSDARKDICIYPKSGISSHKRREIKRDTLAPWWTPIRKQPVTFSWRAGKQSSHLDKLGHFLSAPISGSKRLVYSGINSRKSPTSGATNCIPSRMMSQFGIVR